MIAGHSATRPAVRLKPDTTYVTRSSWGRPVVHGPPAASAAGRLRCGEAGRHVREAFSYGCQPSAARRCAASAARKAGQYENSYNW